MFGNAGARATEILTAMERESATLSMRVEHSAMWTGDFSWTSLFVDKAFLCGQVTFSFLFCGQWISIKIMWTVISSSLFLDR